MLSLRSASRKKKGITSEIELTQTGSTSIAFSGRGRVPAHYVTTRDISTVDSENSVPLKPLQPRPKQAKYAISSLSSNDSNGAHNSLDRT